MRTKKQIREGVSLRIIIGYVLMVIASIMLIVGYLAHEYNFAFIEVLRENATSQTILTVVTIIWFVVSVILFGAGLLIIVFRTVRHHDYVERDYSSRV